MPVESLVKLDWDECRSKMDAFQPDIVQQRAIVVASALRLFAIQAGDFLAGSFDPVAKQGAVTKAFGEARYIYLKQFAYFRQVIHQSNHSLARFFLEINASYKQFATATRLREIAVKRLDAERVLYERGERPVARYLDAVTQFASAVAQEAQFRARYNVALVAVEEVQGTLLDLHKITVADSTFSPAKGRSSQANVSPVPVQRMDANVQRTSATSAVTMSESVSPPKPIPPAPVSVPAPTSALASTPTTLQFDLMIGDAKPLRVRGSLTISRDPARDSMVSPSADQP